jgi:hypothetical protein
MSKASSEQLFNDDDPFDDPLWQRAADMAGAPPRPASGYVTCPLAWLARMLPLVHSAEQLLVLQLIYRRCLLTRSPTVAFPNGELTALGIRRQTKYRALAQLSEAGLVSVEAQDGRAPHVTLHDFP